MTSARHSKVTPRWGTDPAYVVMARTALGGRIELDPMSEPRFNEVVQAERFLTEQDDCFRYPWHCSSLLLNPAGGLFVEAWRRLCAEYSAGHVRRAIWIGFSVEQLCILADEPWHPDDFSKLTCRQRIDFTTLHPRRRVLRRWQRSGGWRVRLACEHVADSARRPPAEMRCTECIGTPEPNGAPSHGNYVVGLGVEPAVFEAAFAGRGRFSHGRLALSRPVVTEAA